LKWTCPECDPASAAELGRALDLTAPAARVLWSRGYRTADSARRFLEPSLSDLADPGLLKDMPEAVARLRRAIEQKERILLYGDYDVDGTSAIVILKKGFDLLGGPFTCRTGSRMATACAAR